MATFLPDCVRLDEEGNQWAGRHIAGEGTRWQRIPRNATIVRPPPGDLRCEVCERPASEVPRYGGPGDPLPGDYSDAVLVKRARSKGLMGSSWECRDCIVLNDEDYLRRLRMR